MGFIATLYLGLFVWALRRNADKKESLYRLVTLAGIAIANVGIAAIISALGTTPEDKEGAWVIIPIYFLAFGWRVVLDIITCAKKERTNYEAAPSNRSIGIQKYSSIAIMIGCAGIALFVGIVLVSLIIYGRVYLFDGYDYTKVLVILSFVCMFIGISGLIVKALCFSRRHTTPTTEAPLSKDDEIARRLLLYKDLLDKGAITQEEYEEKKRQILDL